MYKYVQQIGTVESSETIAGICPKYDKTQYAEVPVPGTQLWCGESSGSICTFPFIFESKLRYEPYTDAEGVSRCGTKDNSFQPIEYAYVNELDEAVPCKGLKNISIATAHHSYFRQCNY